jgi:hypothetical protein
MSRCQVALHIGCQHPFATALNIFRTVWNRMSQDHPNACLLPRWNGIVAR